MKGELGLAVGKAFGTPDKSVLVLFANAGVALSKTTVSVGARQDATSSAGPVLAVGTSILPVEYVSFDVAARLPLFVPGGLFGQLSFGMTIGRKRVR